MARLGGRTVSVASSDTDERFCEDDEDVEEDEDDMNELELELKRELELELDVNVIKEDKRMRRMIGSDRI